MVKLSASKGEYILFFTMVKLSSRYNTTLGSEQIYAQEQRMVGSIYFFIKSFFFPDKLREMIGIKGRFGCRN